MRLKWASKTPNIRRSFSEHCQCRFTPAGSDPLPPHLLIETWQCALTALARLEPSGALTWSARASPASASASHKGNTSQSTCGHKWDRSLDLQLRLTMRELLKFGRCLSTRVAYLFPGAALWMRDARLRSEWMDLYFMYQIYEWASWQSQRASEVFVIDQRDAGLQICLKKNKFIWTCTIFSLI